MLDVITFGSATQDIYVKSGKFLPVLGRKFTTGKGICLTLGSKIKVDDIFLGFGGGGTNAAATFANQGLKVAFCGQVGKDCFGGQMDDEMKKLKIGTDLVLGTKSKLTNTSVFLVFPGKDRTILVYRGASDDLEKSDIPWQKIKKARWFYLAPFSGKLASLTEELVNFAHKAGIRVAWNPGYNQLKFKPSVLQRILDKIDILILNQEEASLLAKVPFQKEKDIFERIDEMMKGIAIMTKGGQGAVVSDGRYLYRAPSLKSRFVDATGAGDAFGSGFVAGMIKKNSVTFAIQLAMANSSSCVGQWGAKNGLLKKNQKWPRVKITKELCLETGLCQTKI
jgi:sugar/nucleoside kinase (ribokinase family)